jgi:hypothetical protein
MTVAIGVEQIARECEQAPTVLRVDLADREVLVEPLARLGSREGGRIWRDAQLAAAEVAGEVHHRRQLGAREDPAHVQQRLVGHHQTAGTDLGRLDRGR